MGTQIVEVLVDGGKASPGPPLGPTLAPLKVNTKSVVEAINKKTSALAGMKVPVKILINTATKEFSLDIGTPPVSSIIMKELNLEKGSPTPGSRRAGDLTEGQIQKIAEIKFGSASERYTSMVRGAARSMGVTIGQGAVTPEELKRYEELDKAKAAAAAAPAPEAAAPTEASAEAKPAAKPAKPKPGKK